MKRVDITWYIACSGFIHAYMGVYIPQAAHCPLSTCLHVSSLNTIKQVSVIIHENSQPWPRASGIGQSKCPLMALILQSKQAVFAPVSPTPE